ncbi:MAG: adenosylmethionine decarboxylase [Saprospiraceae bacterium]
MTPPQGLGTQFALEITGCTAEALATVAGVEKTMRLAAEAIGATVLSGHFHQFEPHGVSGVLVISESHFAIHTWPELGYAAIDLFTCGDKRLRPDAALPIFAKHWGATGSKSTELVRGEGIT